MNSVGDHDATVGLHCDEGRQVTSNDRKKWCKSTHHPSQYQISILQHGITPWKKLLALIDISYKATREKVTSLQVKSTSVTNNFVTLKK